MAKKKESSYVSEDDLQFNIWLMKERARTKYSDAYIACGVDALMKLFESPINKSYEKSNRKLWEDKNRFNLLTFKMALH